MEWWWWSRSLLVVRDGPRVLNGLDGENVVSGMRSSQEEISEGAPLPSRPLLIRAFWYDFDPPY